MGFKVLTLLAFVIVTLGAPRGAEAAIYIWKDVNGSWTEPTNWTPVDGGTTFPNGPGDQALFSASYTAFRTVVIPNGVTVTVGRIHFADRAMTITADGTGRLRLDNGPGAASEITRVGLPAGVGDVIGAPIDLASNTDIAVDTAGAHILLSGSIVNAGCLCGITKKASGRLFLRGDNAYLGKTSVEGGQLVLDVSNTPAIKGPLEIGTDVAGTGYAAEVLIAKRIRLPMTARSSSSSEAC